eukprot:Nitzschia sp. Nitz4//scaffold19_size178191//4350//5735//NITZ4_001951-RA/size178191-processed-gene-0.0-mRNA-1//1//CDS//3329540601//4998//frame0
MRFSVLLVCILLSVVLPRQAEGQNFFQRMVGNKKKDAEGEGQVLTKSLENGVEIPLVGVGVGNMVAEVIPAIVSHAIRSDKKTRLIDTSSVSHNEHLVAKGIVEGADILANSGVDKVEVHVITKVWYSHLGYDRTVLAVKESLAALQPAIDHKNVDLKVHVLIHWPRCYDSIPWMNCEGEEEDLPDEVKALPPAPHTDKENSWKGSWKALEAMYNDSSNPVVSIGVSNFQVKELEALSEMATIKPHILEANVWSFLYDPLLVNYCNRNKIHLTAFNVFEGTLRHPRQTPFGYHHLLTVSNELTKDMHDKGLLSKDLEINAPQTVLVWFIQHEVTVIPRTTDLSHLKENSAVTMDNIPKLTDKQFQTVAHALEALISGTDMEEDAAIRVTFHAKTKDLYLWWRDDADDVEILVSVIKKGESFVEESHPGHKFRVYDQEEKEDMPFELYHVEGRYGDHHHVEL